MVFYAAVSSTLGSMLSLGDPEEGLSDEEGSQTLEDMSNQVCQFFTKVQAQYLEDKKNRPHQ